MSMFKTSRCLSGLIAAAVMSVGALSASANSGTYPGNGGTGFGGPVGNGSFAISDDGTNITFTLNPSGGFGNDCVIYIDSVAGGFPDTSLFFDNGDGGREAVSGYNAGNPSQTIAVFPAGFDADYALSIENTYMGLFGLAAGGNNSLNFITGANQTGPTYSVTFPIADLGITGGQSFAFVGTLISETAYRSNESFGNNNAGGSNPGFSTPMVFTSDDTYTTTAVPEPTTLGVLGAASLLAASRRRRA
jgi:hypothetical protein